MTTRRDVLAAGVAGAALLSLSALPAGARTTRKASKRLKILVLGGTGFLGPHFVEAARVRGHTLTLFNRGKTNPGRFGGKGYRDIEQLKGDRKTDLAALEGKRRWDAVLDTSAYIPADVTRSAALLASRVKHYLLISTISVHAKSGRPAFALAGGHRRRHADVLAVAARRAPCPTESRPFARARGRRAEGLARDARRGLSGISGAASPTVRYARASPPRRPGR